MFLLSSYLILFSYNIQGNGSQAIWYEDERVLYISLHRWTLLFSYLYLFSWLWYIFAGMESIRERKSTPVETLEGVTRLERNQQWGTTSTLVRSPYTAVHKCWSFLYINDWTIYLERCTALVKITCAWKVHLALVQKKSWLSVIYKYSSVRWNRNRRHWLQSCIQGCPSCNQGKICWNAFF